MNGLDLKSLAIFAVGIAAFGAALGQGRAAGAALEGIARNPNASSRIQTPMILSFAMLESLVLFVIVAALILRA